MLPEPHVSGRRERTRDFAKIDFAFRLSFTAFQGRERVVLEATHWQDV